MDRLAFSVIWELTVNGDIVGHRFCKSIIRSKAALTYAEAQAIIDDVERMDPLAANLRTLNELAKCLMKKRVDKG